MARRSIRGDSLARECYNAQVNTVISQIEEVKDRDPIYSGLVVRRGRQFCEGQKLDISGIPSQESRNVLRDFLISLGLPIAPFEEGENINYKSDTLSLVVEPPSADKIAATRFCVNNKSSLGNIKAQVAVLFLLVLCCLVAITYLTAYVREKGVVYLLWRVFVTAREWLTQEH